MKSATRVLPEGYQPTHEINLARNKSLALALNLAGLVLFFLTLGLNVLFLGQFRPEALRGGMTLLDGRNLPGKLLALFGLVVGNLVVHELIHGLFFRLFTGSAPRYGLGLSYAYAAAPDWYIPRRKYQVTGLAPVVLIGLGCLLLMMGGPLGWVFPLALVAAMNTSGSVGDLLIVGVVQRSGRGCLVNDRGDGVWVYENGRATGLS